MMGCYKQCKHVEITDILKEIATEQEQKLAQQKGIGNSTTRPYSGNRDYVGSIGQNCISDFFETTGMSGGLILSPYYSPNMHADNFDFEYRGITYDVKSTMMKKYKFVTGYSTYIINDHQQNKRVGRYCFVSVDLDNDMCHIAGVIDYDKFWSLSNPAVGDWVKGSAHIIEAKYLMPISDIV